MKIMLLEDDLNTLRFYQKVLGAADHQTFSAATITAAEQLLNRQTFDVCLCDVGIGLLNALDWLERLPGHKLDKMQVIVVTGQDQQYARCKADSLRVYRKPISSEELLEAVNACAAVDQP